MPPSFSTISLSLPNSNFRLSLPPGFLFLLQGAITFVFPTLIFYQLSFYLTLYLPPSTQTYKQISNTLRALFSVLTFICFVTLKIQYTRLSHKYRANALGARVVDTPGGWPGNFSSLIRMAKAAQFGYPGDGLREELYDHGNVYNRRICFEDVIMTTEPHHIKAILASDASNYVKGAPFRRACSSVLGDGVFNSDGEMSKFHRSIMRPFFHRDRISDFELFDRHADEIIGLICQRSAEGYSIDFQDAMSRFTLDSATEFLFGSSVHSMSTGIPYPHHAPTHLELRRRQAYSTSSTTADAFAAAFGKSQILLATRLGLGWIWPLLEIFDDKTQDPMRVVDAFVEPIVRDAVEKNKKRSQDKVEGGEEAKQGEEEEVTLLDHLVKYTTDEKMLKDETTNILIAGRDTTASTLTFMFFFLATHPHVTARLREEIMEHVGPNRMPVYEDIKKMKYLKAVINETLRLFPAVPMNFRCSIDEATWPSAIPGEKPYYIPPNTRVAYSVFLMHRRTDLWGPDAEEFDPDRFLDDRVRKYIVPNSFIFLPFNAGPRICLGQQFAYNEMSFITIRLLQRFGAFSLDRASQPPDSLPPAEWASDVSERKGRDGLFPQVHLTMDNKGGLWMKMEESTLDEALC